MKNILICLAIVAAVLVLGLAAYADVTLKQNGGNIGRVEELNEGRVGTAGVNWTGLYNFRTGEQGSIGINWSELHALDASYGSHSGINWQSFGV
jgi:hypothetical protein